MYVQFEPPSNIPDPQMKTILLWTPRFSDPSWYISRSGLSWEGGKHTDLRDFGCDHESYKCTITANRSYLEDESLYDGFLFHERDFNQKDIPDQGKRRDNQLYIFKTLESPINNPNLNDNQGQKHEPSINNKFFNATMTYSSQSDVHIPYGKIVKMAKHPTGKKLDEYIDIFGKENARHVIPKNFSSVILISNCGSQNQREKTLYDLAKVVPLDCFGDCCEPSPFGGYDHWSAAKSDFWIEQHRLMGQTYQFYLAFENSNCNDYVSERFFNVLHADMIPVVMNGANMSLIAPKHSFIDVKDFQTIRELGKYLEKVSSDPSLYASYFWWRKHYEVHTFMGKNWVKYFCDACRYVHTAKGPRIVEDLKKDWGEGGQCHWPNITYIDEEDQQSSSE